MYICKNCWSESLKWSWKCLSCKEWWTLEEKIETKSKPWMVSWDNKQLTLLTDPKNDWKEDKRIVTTSWEFNSVLWGWIVEWSLILLSWEPGIWKSTLTLQIGSWAKSNKIIYVSGEENEAQIMSRAVRLWVSGENISLLNESNLENILETIKNNKSDLVIVDSISVLSSDNMSWSAWSINQVRYIAETLMHFAKATNTAIILIGHVTKDWNLAWPKALEHLVDTVLYFEGDKFDNLRILRWIKNRFGSTNEVWIFKMVNEWLIDVKNPSSEFIEKEKDPTIGSALSLTLEWSRALIVETESLTTYTKFGYPKRSARWINNSKLDMMIAVIWKYTQIKLDSYDIYTNLSRGLRIEEPGIDLAVYASIVSSKLNSPIDRESIFIWEISLTWKIKNVFELEKRIKEAEKLWYKKIYTPVFDAKIKTKIEIIQIKNITELIKYIWNV